MINDIRFRWLDLSIDVAITPLEYFKWRCFLSLTVTTDYFCAEALAAQVVIFYVL